jgi:hypothetical protein
MHVTKIVLVWISSAIIPKEFSFSFWWKNSHEEIAWFCLGASMSFSTQLLMIKRCVQFRQASEPSGLSVPNYRSTTTDEGKIRNGISSQQRQKSQTSRTL